MFNGGDELAESAGTGYILALAQVRCAGTCIFPSGRTIFLIVALHPGIALKLGVGDDWL